MMRTLCITYLCILLIVVGSRNVKTIAQDEVAVSSIGWSPDGSKLAIAYSDGDIQIENTNRHLLFELIGHTEPAYQLAWSRTNDRLASLGVDGTLRVWDASDQSSQRLQLTINSHDPDAITMYVVWNSDGTEIITNTFYQETSIRSRWNSTSGNLIEQENRGYHLELEWSSDGSKAASTSGNAILLYDPETLDTVVDVLENTNDSTFGNRMLEIAWHPHDTNIIASGSVDGKIRIWDIAARGIVLELDANDAEVVRPTSPSRVLDLAFSADGQVLSSISADGTLRSWRTTNLNNWNSWEVIENQTLSKSIGRANINLEGTSLVYSDNNAVVIETINQPPTANIPYGFTIQQHPNPTMGWPDPMIVTVLNDHWTDDPDVDDELTYHWEVQLTDGEWSTLYEGDDEQITFDLGAVVGDACPVRVRLTVTDVYGAAASDTISIDCSP